MTPGETETMQEHPNPESASPPASGESGPESREGFELLRRRIAGPVPLVAGILVGLFLLGIAGRNLLSGVENPALAVPPAGPPPAEDDLLRAIERNPDVAALWARLGAVRFDRGRYAQALEAYREAARRNPLWAPYHREAGLALFKLGRAAEADREMELAARLHPQNPDLQFKIGKYFLLLRAFPGPGEALVFDEEEIRARRQAKERAQEAFRRAADLDLSYLARAIPYYEKCLPGPRNIEPLVPVTSEGLEAFARYLAGRRSWSYAAEIWLRLIGTAGEERAQWRLEAGRALLGAGDVEGSRRQMVAAAAAHELTDGQVALIASIYLGFQKPREGIKTLNEVRTHVRPEKSRIFTQIGKLWWAAGQANHAGVMFEKSALQSHDPEAYYHLAIISETAGNDYGAEQYYLQAVRGGRDIPAYRYRLGLLYFRQKRFSDAITALEEAVRLAPENETYRKALAKIVSSLSSQG
jgi:tetratricopeptide (TPR) repeat protein